MIIKMIVTSGFIFANIINAIIAVFIYLIVNVNLKEGILLRNKICNSGIISDGSTLTPLLVSDYDNAIYQYDPKSGLNLNIFKLTDGATSMLNMDGMYCYVAMSTQDHVTLINLTNGLTLNIYTGLFPVACVEDGTYVWVANKGSSTISLVNMSSYLVDKKIDCQGTIPVDLAYDGNNRMYAALAGSKQIVQYNVWTLDSLNFYVGDNLNVPIKICIDGAGKLWILGSNGLVQTLDLNTFQLQNVIQIAVQNVSALYANETNLYIGTSDGMVLAYIQLTMSLVASIVHDTSPIVGINVINFDIFVMSRNKKFSRYDSTGNLILNF